MIGAVSPSGVVKGSPTTLSMMTIAALQYSSFFPDKVSLACVSVWAVAV